MTNLLPLTRVMWTEGMHESQHETADAVAQIDNDDVVEPTRHSPT